MASLSNQARTVARFLPMRRSTSVGLCLAPDYPGAAIPSIVQVWDRLDRLQNLPAMLMSELTNARLDGDTVGCRDAPPVAGWRRQAFDGHATAPYNRRSDDWTTDSHHRLHRLSGRSHFIGDSAGEDTFYSSLGGGFDNRIADGRIIPRFQVDRGMRLRVLLRRHSWRTPVEKKRPKS